MNRVTPGKKFKVLLVNSDFFHRLTSLWSGAGLLVLGAELTLKEAENSECLGQLFSTIVQ